MAAGQPNCIAQDYVGAGRLTKEDEASGPACAPLAETLHKTVPRVLQHCCEECSKTPSSTLSALHAQNQNQNQNQNEKRNEGTPPIVPLLPHRAFKMPCIELDAEIVATCYD